MSDLLTLFIKIIIVVSLSLFLASMLFSVIEPYTSPKDPVLDELRDQLAVLDPKFENVSINEGDKSYTINKSRVFICLKDKHGRYYDRNMLCYVILHEYAHILCDEVGHTEKFFNIFDELLDKAAEMGLYDPSIPPVENYCGHN